MIDELKALRVEAAALRRERDQLQSNVAAARRECDLYSKALREISERIDSKKNPQAARARGIASAALAAPAAGRDPAIEDADAAWRDGEAHGRDK